MSKVRIHGTWCSWTDPTYPHPWDMIEECPDCGGGLEMVETGPKDPEWECLRCGCRVYIDGEGGLATYTKEQDQP